jgi:hypothetical protein
MKKLIFAVCMALGLVACGGGGGSSELAGSEAISADALVALKAKVVVPDPTLVGQGVSLVNTTTAGDQIIQTIGAIADGGYTVSWTSGTSTFIQRYDSAGAKSGGETLIAGTGSVAVLRDGSIVVAAVEGPAVGPGHMAVVVSRFDASGVLLGQTEAIAIDRITNPTGPSITTFFRDARVVPLADGGFVVAWVAVSPSTVGIFNTVFTQRYDSQGQPVGGRVEVERVNAPSNDFVSYGLAADAQGGYTVSVFRPTLVAPFTTLTSVFHIDANGTARQIVTLQAGGVLLLPLEGDRFVLFTSDSSGSFLQLLDSEGNPVGDPTPIVAMPFEARELVDGSFVVFWNTSAIITAQRFDSNGMPLGNLLTLTTHAIGATAAALADGGFALAWSGPNIGGDLDVFTQRFIEVLDNAHAALRAKRKACLVSAKGMVGQERKAFMDACLQ